MVDKEKLYARQKQWRLDNPEKYKAIRQRSRKKNRDRAREYAREYYWKNREKILLNRQGSNYNPEYYKSRRDQINAKDREKHRVRREEWVKEHGPCAHCGSWDNPEIDHINPEEKELWIRKIWRRSQAVRDKELAKCQVLCGRCHRRKTYKENH